LSTTAWQTDEWEWNRGAVLNYYDTSFTARNPNAGPGNNGNVLRSEVYIPNDDQISGYTFMRQNYGYDALNRLTSVTELQNGSSTSFMQAYDYDRWGNRKINSGSWGSGINVMQTAVDANSNRMYAPSDPTHTLMDYDSAGNQTKDYLIWNGTRTYDAENRMITANNGAIDKYTYDADGKRTRRKVGEAETWYLYGMGGELLAEYAPNSPATTPVKEYGYRNGQLLIIADAPTPQNVEWTNAVGVSISGNSLTKTAATAWGNAGAASTQTLTAGDGYVEMTVGETGHARIFGLSHTDSSQSWDTIDFGLHCSNHANNSIYVYESGTERGAFGAYAVGDKLRVAIVGGVVKYSKNGTVFYTSTVPPTYPLRVDAALYENSATLMTGIVCGNLSSGGSGSKIQWLVADQLGTPRMIADSTGSLAGIKHHDYLPFGEELFANQGGRTTSQGYSVNDGIRQKFTSKERDNETGLDYFLSRYYSSTQGRFTSPDEFTGGPDELYYFVDDASANPTFYADLRNPQSLNKYQYTYNNPLRFVDPDGHDVEYENDRLRQQFENIAKESKTFAGELVALNDDHKITVVVVERGLKTNDEKSSGDATITFNSDGTTRVVIAVDSHGRTPDRTKEHEVGHGKDARTNREQLRKDALKTQKNKGGPGEKPHDERPEEKRANAFRDQVERERKQYRKEQEAERKRQKQQKKKQEQE
jgi:RHS repeat-associated protein